MKYINKLEFWIIEMFKSGLAKIFFLKRKKNSNYFL